MFPRRSLPFLFVLLFALCGSLIAYFASRYLQVSRGRADLKDYSIRLIDNALGLSLDARQAHDAVTGSGESFCSDQEIALMRRTIYSSRTVKEMERIRNGKIECTAVLGHLQLPVTIGQPDTGASDFRVYSAPVAAGGDSPGYISEWPGTAVVINPAVLENLDEPPMDYEGRYYARDVATGKPSIRGGFGHGMPVSNVEMLAGKTVERQGITYFSRCAPEFSFCVITSVPSEAMFRKGKWITAFMMCFGTFCGASLPALPVLYARRQRTLETHLRRAIRAGALRMVYQPVIDLATGRVIGAEALVRWQDKAGEYVRPDVFIPLAEERGFIQDITHYVVRRTLAEMRNELQGGGFRLSVNISAQDLASPDFCDWLGNELAAAGVQAGAVALELTERTTARGNAIPAIARLHDAGHAIYLDDFGTGYSSLSYLHQLKLTAIKIDRTFTQTVGTDSVAASVVPQILAMAAKLDLSVVVEGIETEAQADYFRASGPSILGQGYHLGRPIAAAELKERLRLAALILL